MHVWICVSIRVFKHSLRPLVQFTVSAARCQGCIRLPGSSRDACLKEKALISVQMKHLLCIKKFLGCAQISHRRPFREGPCRSERRRLWSVMGCKMAPAAPGCATFSISWRDKWDVRAHGSAWNRNISGIFTCISLVAVYEEYCLVQHNTQSRFSAFTNKEELGLSWAYRLLSLGSFSYYFF